MGSRSHWLFLLAPMVVSCGAEGDALPDDGNELPSLIGAPTDAGSDAGAADASKPRPRSDGSVGAVGGGGTDDPLTEGSACAASSLAAEQVIVEEEVQVEVEVTKPAPVALYVMLDKSSSMATSNLWTPATKALSDFIVSPASSGMDMALQYFPGGGQCNGTGYSTPAVALGRLPAHAGALTASIDKQNADGFGTPIEGALRGVTDYCKTFQANNAKERCVAVLVTDGVPQFDGCEHDNAKLAAIADAAWKQFQVRTFAVGLKGADFTLLDLIAKAGGAADCDPSSARFACDVSSGADKLSTALAKIRDTVATVEVHTELQTTTKPRPLECTWKMPLPSAGLEVDSGRVNVTLSGGSSLALDLGRVPSESNCRAGAWYFDVPSAPERIIACPQTCDTIKSAGYTDVKILLGCQTNLILL
jgi:Mg-chelatase subunit ChlD